MEWKHIHNWFYLGQKFVLIIAGLFWAPPTWAKASVLHERRDSKRNKSTSLTWKNDGQRETSKKSYSWPLVVFFSIMVCGYHMHQIRAWNAQAVQPRLWLLDAENCADGKPFLASFATYLQHSVFLKDSVRPTKSHSAWLPVKLTAFSCAV